MQISYNNLILIVVSQLFWGVFPVKSSQTAEKELEHKFNLEVNLLAGESCLELQNISETILKDEILNKSSSFVVQALKTKLAKIEEIFPYYLRFGYNESLLNNFYQIVDEFQQSTANDDKDFAYTKNLLKNLGLKHIFENYKNNFMKIFPKLENEIQLDDITNRKYIKWMNNLEKCRRLECCLSSRQKNIFTVRDNFVGFLQKHLMDMTISFVNNATLYSKRLLNSPKLSQLNPDTKEFFIKNIYECLKEPELCKNIFQILIVPLTYHDTISFYADNDDVSLKELRLIEQIINENGYEELMSGYRKNYDNFLKNDLLKEVERLKATVSNEKLMKGRHFWDHFDKLRNAATFEERVKIVNEIDKSGLSVIRI